jgi:hypothetical protein
VKVYQSIEKKVVSGQPIYAFDKLDGSNIRVEWTPKGGFTKFGARRRLLDPNEEPLGEAVTLINELTGEIGKRLKKERVQKATCYFEFYGDNSFAGSHEDEEHRVVLFDIDFFKKGLIPPKDFIKLTEGLPVPEMVYHGNANGDFIKSIIEGTHPGVTDEGVVCKYLDKKITKMFKIKSKAWIDRLKHHCQDDDDLFNRLA